VSKFHLTPPQINVTTGIAATATPTFGIFVTGSATVPDLPGLNRIYVIFTDAKRGAARRDLGRCKNAVKSAAQANPRSCEGPQSALSRRLESTIMKRGRSGNTKKVFSSSATVP
jgi:hypothetical protein